MYETTTDLLNASIEVLAQAEKVTTREEHASVWDKKVDVLRYVNYALETGGHTGEAYEELRRASYNLYKAEEVAGKQSMLTYMKNR